MPQMSSLGRDFNEVEAGNEGEVALRAQELKAIVRITNFRGEHDSHDSPDHIKSGSDHSLYKFRICSSEYHDAADEARAIRTAVLTASSLINHSPISASSRKNRNREAMAGFRNYRSRM